MTITKDDVLGAANQLKEATLKALSMGIHVFCAELNYCYMESELFNEFFARGARLLIEDARTEFPVIAASEAGGIEFRAIYGIEEAKKAWSKRRIEKLLHKGAE